MNVNLLHFLGVLIGVSSMTTLAVTHAISGDVAVPIITGLVGSLVGSGAVQIGQTTNGK